MGKCIIIVFPFALNTTTTVQSCASIGIPISIWGVIYAWSVTVFCIFWIIPMQGNSGYNQREPIKLHSTIWKRDGCTPHRAHTIQFRNRSGPFRNSKPAFNLRSIIKAYAKGPQRPSEYACWSECISPPPMHPLVGARCIYICLSPGIVVVQNPHCFDGNQHINHKYLR